MIDRISQTNIDSMLQTLRAYQTQSMGTTGGVDSQSAITGTQAKSNTFFESVKSALDRVNDADTHADAMSDAYERGEEVPLTDVVLSMQKASLSFEATLQVRNKVMKAYEEIMNMPV
jgi:flagellar hook-basal body complex protein FliE